MSDHKRASDDYRSGPSLRLMALEPRVLLDGAALVAGVEVVAETECPERSHSCVVDSDDRATQAVPGESGNEGYAGPPPENREVVFIDAGVEDQATLLKDVTPHADIVFLDPRRDGIRQISQALAGRTSVEAIHLISHGGAGSLQLGSGTLSAETLAQHTESLRSWRHALTADADILIYGCTVAQGERGERFVQALSHHTGADVAASDDTTGSREGADWTLEWRTGTIESVMALDSRAMADYSQTLATITVTNTNDSGSGSFRQAITDASSGDTITFDGSLSGQTINMTSGQYALTKDLTIDGDLNDDNTPDIILDASASNSRIFNNSATVSITGLTLQNADGNIGSGGGIFNSGTLTLSDSALSNITADGTSGDGGGILSYGTLTISNTSFTNTSSLDNGGAIRFWASGKTLTITDSTFTSNSAPRGGAILVTDGNAYIANSTFTSNSASSVGGAIYSLAGVTTVVGSTFTSNTAVQGGAFYNAATLDIIDSTITGNSTTLTTGQYLGGGIRQKGGTVRVYTSTIDNNTAGLGGGIYVGGGDVELYRTTISGNTAGTTGAGIRQRYASGDLTIVSSTIAGNNGDGLVIHGDADSTVITNSIFADNTGVDINGNVTNSNFNIIEDAGSATFTAQANDITGADPSLAALATVAGYPTQIHALNGGSNALNSGVGGADRGVTVTNSIPVLANLAGDTLAYTEDDAATVIEQGSDATVTDSDSGNFNTGTLTVSISANRVSTEDVLSINNQGTGSGQIGLSGTTVTYEGATIGTMTGGSGTDDLVVTFSEFSTATAVTALLKNITYQNSNTGDPSTNARTVDFVVTDGDGGTSATSSATVNITAVNDAPTISALSGDDLSYEAGDGAKVIDQGGNASVGDVDSTDFNGGTLTVSISSNRVSGEDQLAIRNQGTAAGEIGTTGANVTYGGVVIGTFTGGTGTNDLVITFNAASTPTAAGVLLQNITYEDTNSDTPSENTRTIQFVLTDGDGGTSATYNTTVTWVIPVVVPAPPPAMPPPDVGGDEMDDPEEEEFVIHNDELLTGARQEDPKQRHWPWERFSLYSSWIPHEGRYTSHIQELIDSLNRTLQWSYEPGEIDSSQRLITKHVQGMEGLEKEGRHKPGATGLQIQEDLSSDLVEDLELRSKAEGGLITLEKTDAEPVEEEEAQKESAPKEGVVSPGTTGPVRVESGIPDRSLPASGTFTIPIPKDAFAHRDANTSLTLHGRLADGSPLPEWLSLDVKERHFISRGDNQEHGTWQIVLTARDTNGNEATITLELTIGTDFRSLEVEPASADGAMLSPPVGKPALSAQFRDHGRSAFDRARSALLSLLVPVLCTLVLFPDPVQATDAPVRAAFKRDAPVRAQVRSTRRTVLSAEVSARVVRIEHKAGERFAKGALLVTLDCAIQQAQLKQAQAAHHLALKKRAANARLADLLSSTPLEVETTEAEAARTEANAFILEKQVERCRIMAPFSGRIVEWKTDPHRFVQAGQALVEIVDDRHLELTFLVPSRRINTLKAGHPLRLTVDETGKNYQAVLVRRGAVVDPVGQRIRVTAEIRSDHTDLLPGMSGSITFIDRKQVH
ncbi:MAG: efflux RND transporter periplasmic adaptor subunit [Magnetococcales bacterium]|nr:efflux RND transporter periplasmic adaptor subunit [Magnetococcales bacterium]